MYELAGIFLHVDLMDTDFLFCSVLLCDLHPSVAADRLIELRDLVVLRIIGIEIIFPVKLAVLVDLAVCRKTNLHRVLNHLSVQHRKRPRHAGTDRTGMAVRRTAESG